MNSENFIPEGTLLNGRYRIDEPIGSGGFGITYKGFDTFLGLIVAVKEYLPGDLATRVPGETQVSIYTGDETDQFEKGRLSFLEEARRLAQLRDEDGIVSVYDCFEENFTAYIVMEYMDGETLKSILKREGKLSVDTSCKIIKSVLLGLIKVHKNNILHRDIAPDNIFITRDGKIKLFDFGSARTVINGRTRMLTVEIKPGYSPVEQYTRRGNQGPWTDVYSTAATMYRMITGHIPQGSIERKSKDRLRKPSEEGIKISQSVENALMNALNIDPDDRTQSAEEFLRQLENADTKRKKIKRTNRDIGGIPTGFKIAGILAVILITTGFLILRTDLISFDTSTAGKFLISAGITRVPNLVNYPIDKAEEEAKKVNIQLTVSAEEYSDVIPEGYIISQNPVPGSLTAVDSVVEVIRCKGIKREYMPSLIGMNADSAKKIMDDLNTGYLIESETSQEYEEGLVIKQSIAEGDVIEKGMILTITVSSGMPETETERETAAKKPRNSQVQPQYQPPVQYNEPPTIADNIG